MTDPPSYDVDYSDPSPDDLVTFSVLCQPAPGVDLATFRHRLGQSDVGSLLPVASVLDGVSARLRALGFEVFDLPGIPLVSARGRVDRFETVFHTRLTRMRRRLKDSQLHQIDTGIIVNPAHAAPSPAPVPGALLISVAEPPLLANTVLNFTDDEDICLAMPNDIAAWTGASTVPALSKKARVKVAVVDTGFAQNTFFKAREYHIERIAAPDTTNPGVDDREHGTYVLANLLACAPEVMAYGVKYEYVETGFARAIMIPGIRIISLSWYYALGGGPDPDWLTTLELLIAYADSIGITVVVCTGNFSHETSPARMPQVIAVGGVTIDSTGTASAWRGTSCFVTASNPARKVPDICGVASEMQLPLPGNQSVCKVGETSCATPQVAGAAALLLQKVPSLTSQNIRNLLMLYATDVQIGATNSGFQAGPGPDLASGAGLVNAYHAWQNAHESL